MHETKRVRVIGLTGGIAMGKSTVAARFRGARIPVFDADRAVHELQGRGGAAVAPIARLLPGVVVNGAVDRQRLRLAVGAEPSLLPALERILHPMVRQRQRRFLARARAARAPFAVLDVPLLFETGGDRACDLVLVVSAPSTTQRQRLRARGTMPDSQIDRILARQLPDIVRRMRADLVIRTGLSRGHAALALRRLLHRLRNGDQTAPAFIKKSSPRRHQPGQVPRRAVRPIPG